jgi:transcription elongation GreA/GreB family factor
VSKAFTKEDDDGGVAFAAGTRAVPERVTSLGSRLARERLREVAARLERAPPAGATDHAGDRAALEIEQQRLGALAQAKVALIPQDTSVVAFGAQVRVRDQRGKERVVFLASAEEIGLVPNAASATAPVARALLGARSGDDVELEGPRGPEELTVVDVSFPA